MSYCRWSSDGFQSDVYVYLSNDGYIVHVASMRHPKRVPDLDWSTPESMKRTYAEYRAALDDPGNEPVSIGLSEDGKTFLDDTPQCCADRLIWLKSLGYNIPQYAIDALLEESHENDHRD